MGLLLLGLQIQVQQKRAASLVDRLFALLEPTSEEEEDEEEEEEVTKNAVGPPGCAQEQDL